MRADNGAESRKLRAECERAQQAIDLRRNNVLQSEAFLAEQRSNTTQNYRFLTYLMVIRYYDLFNYTENHGNRLKSRNKSVFI